MSTNPPSFSELFRRLYCDTAAFDAFSALHPISFRRVLPFQYPDEGVDELSLLLAEEAHLANQHDDTRRAVVDEYARCGLLDQTDASNLTGVLDFYDADFFELMGLVYANLQRFRCALRWYRELILRLETQNPNSCSDTESVYAGVGYCLYSLGLFEEAIAWSKACIGPRAIGDVVCRALIDYEAELAGGAIRVIERAGARTKYTVSAFEPAHVAERVARLKATLKSVAPFQELYLDWVAHDSPTPGPQPGGYPFQAEFDVGTLVRHKMNLIFATCAHADALLAKGYQSEAKRLLCEAAMLEPAATIVADRLRTLS